MTVKYNYVVKTFFGLEKVLAEEMKELGAEDISVGNRAVMASGDMALCYRLNYFCRTALSVLMPVTEGLVRNESQLYELVYSVNWLDIFDVKKTFIIDVICYSDHFTHSHFLAQKSKDAIADQFRDRIKRRPSVAKAADVKINILIKGDRCIISLDTSGDSLFKRGYRLQTGSAPISEVLAAGIIYMSDWDRKKAFVDPMCGSGTFPIEAALLSQKIPPQHWRKAFSFQHLKNFEKNIWEKILDSQRVQSAEEWPIIIGRDIDRRAVNISRSNAANAEIGGINWTKGDFFSWMPKIEPGVLIFNPPYDQRLPLKDASEYYKKIGDHLKKHFTGWSAWIISSHLDAVKQVGLKPTIRIPLFNGPLECRLMHFELY